MPPKSPARAFDSVFAQGRWTEAEAIARRELTRKGGDDHWAVTALVRCALARGDREEMRLWLDRAGRITTKSPDLADFRASMLLAAGDAPAALDHLTGDGKEPEDTAARLLGGTVRAVAWRMAGRIEDAAALAETLLRRHAVPPDAPLTGLLDRLATDLGRPGWMAGPGGDVLIGELRTEAEIRLDGPAPRRWSAVEFRSFFGSPRFSLPVDGAGPWSLTSEGKPFLGSGLTLSTRRIEGVVDIENRLLTGWAASPDDPRLLPILLTDSAGATADVPTEPETGKDGRPRRAFSIDLGKSGLAPGRIAVTADGIALAGSPIAWRRRGEDEILPIRAVPRRKRNCVPAADPILDVVIPVYGDRAVTLACLGRVLATTRHDRVEIVVIDDCTPDRALAEALDALAAQGRITLIRSKTNQGFPASVNRGMALHKKRDVVLLNSDASVSGTWLRRLKTAAYQAADTGSVTALSNEASICSYGPDDPDAWPALDRLARRVNRGVTIELPTAVGFCMYIRRDCLNETGAFSETLFGRGYGEENEFCLRARRLGWRHVAAADVFVGHVGGVSFGASRALLQSRNLKVLERRHPGYLKLVTRFSAADPLAPARRRMDLGRWTPPATATVLLVSLDLEGGASRHVEERRRALEQTGRRVLVLTPAPAARRGGRDSVQRCRLVDPLRPDLRDLVFDSVADIGPLTDLLRGIPVTAIEFHHSLNHHPVILDLPRRLGVPYEMVLHDYHWLCPQVALVGRDGRYCGEPQPSLPHCEACLLELGSESGEKITVAELRRRSGHLLAGANRVVAPSHDVADRYRRYFPAVTPEVVAWDQVSPPHQSVPQEQRKRKRIAVIGAIGAHKGYEELRACAEDAAARDLPLDFVVVGYSSDDAGLFATGRIHVTGRYQEAEAEALVRRQQADCAFLPSVCPETWSYALSLAWRAGLTAAVFDLGAPAERIRAQGGGVLLAFGATPSAINDTLLALSTGFVVDGKANPSNHFEQKEGPMSQSPQIAATPQEMILAPGFYAITVVRGIARSRPGKMALPAILISTPPGEARAEILSSHAGGWLTRQGDTVMLKVTGETPILLTSYKDPLTPADSLEIQFSRVDGSAAGLAPAAPALPQLEILAHVQRLGDQTYDSSGWAGTPGKGQAIEGFALLAKGGIDPDEIEYKGITANGWETPWISGGQFCGTRGQAMPLIGVSVRLKGAAAQRYDAEIEAVFVNGGRAGPARNGAPCRSDVIGAALDGLKLSFSAKA